MRHVTVKDVVLGQGRPKVIVPLTGATEEELLAQARALAEQPVDVVEWRVDLLDGAADTAAVARAAGSVRAAVGGRPLLVSVRTAGQGGRLAVDDGAYGDLLQVLLATGAADLVDVEAERDAAVRRLLLAAARDAGAAVVMSHHDFRATLAEDEIVGRLRDMQDQGADVTKVAVMPHGPGDVLTLLQAAWTMRSRYADRPLIAIAMDRVGLVSRLAGGVFGSAATFATVGVASAPGQAPLAEVRAVLELLHGLGD
ncbi:type I 3-dehydroquinate dehydratase [Georgenia sp. TF02-10]|uniref:type I 3-dehydroquinate dehydratase n=1 Tax=Georgenia sp. TF02-10 TaxID=2917725 RepID=UPI001FA6B326|nr:type I 3-dehydroquinate dehydratase [Georgenia sp. TF02-10]UNX53242.1 type I 3-dehydroquinate dehydratase [Georgenia sp. TF02-10]